MIRLENIIGEVEWPEDHVVLQQAPKAKPRGSGRRRSKKPASEDSSSGSSSSSSSSDSSNKSSSKASSPISSAKGDSSPDVHSGDEDEPPALVAEPPPPPLAPAGDARAPRRAAGRDGSTSLSWGLNRLTPRSTHGCRSAWQMTCNHPDHNLEGFSACTHTRALHFDGGEDACLRLLKYWAITGLRASTKEAHGKMWTSTVELWQRGLFFLV